MLEYAEQKDYKKAMEIADTIDWRRVKNASMLNSVSEIYENNGEFSKSREILFLAYDRSPSSRKIVYRLGILALKLKDTEEATDCYEEFVKLAPKDPNQYILKYKILKTQNAPLVNQIEALEEFKSAEYVEKWAYELALLYQEAGMIAECLEECDDLILWFSEGKYVYQAMELKMKYKPLTPLQQDKYDSRPGTANAKRSQVTYEAPVEEPVEEEADEEVIPADMNIPVAEEVQEPVKESSIRQVVTGATLQEALASGMALATGAVAAIKAGVAEITSQLPIDKVREAEKEEPEEVQEEVQEEPVDELYFTELVIEEPVEEAVVAAEFDLSDAVEEVPPVDVLSMTGELNISEKAMAQRDADMKLSGMMLIDDILAEWEEKQKVNASAIEKQKRADEERLRKEREEIERRREAERIERERLEAEAARKAAERVGEKKPVDGKTQRLPDDILQLVEQLESRVAEPEKARAKDLEDDLEDDEYEDDFQFEMDDEIDEEPEPLQTEGLAELAMAMGSFEDDEDDEFEEEDFEEEDFEEDFEDEDFEEEDFEEDFEDEDFEEEDFEDEDFEEEDLEEDFDEDFEEEDFEEEDFEEEDLEDDFEEDFEEDDFEDDFDEDELPQITDLEEEFKIEEPSEEEIQSRINKSKGGVPFDTGFVVTGRYDLSATSEIGLKVGLTEEQKKLFSYFVPVRGMSEQIVEVLDNDRRAQREGTSKTGNILVIGHKGSGKTVLSVDIVKAIQKQRNLKQGKVAIVTGESLNKKELPNIIQKLRGGAIIIEKAGQLNSRTIKELSYLMEKKTGEMLFVLEDERKPLERLLTANPDFKRKFTSKLELPVFINDELVTFGQTYAKENGYKLDEMGILALYSRIDVLQREDHAVTVAEVKEIMDEAIAHSQKANVKHLARRVFGRGKDESDRIILREEDFRI